MSSRVEPFQAISLSNLAHRLKAEGRSIIHMEFGQPSTGAPRAAIETAHRVLDADGMGYWESEPLKARIARHYDETYGVAVDPTQLVLTCGASAALVLALASTFSPGHPVEIECGAETRFQITAAQIAALDPVLAGVIVASPANPTGTIIPAEEMAAIAQICRERNIRILSDEIYHGISYVAPARSMLEFEPNALVINSFSKYFSMVGWRLGWLLTPMDRRQSARAYVSNMFLTAPSLSQHAALTAMDCRDELEANVEVYRANRALVLEALPRLGLRSIAPPDGAFYVYANVGHLTDDSMEFCKQLLRDTGVATAPGVDFDPVEGRHFIRISFAVSTPEVEEALRRMTPWFAARMAEVAAV